MAPTVKTPLGTAPVIPIALVGIGMYLTWFGVHYWDSDTKWPTDPVKAVLQGKGIPAPSGQTPASTTASNIEGASAAAGVVNGVVTGSSASGSAIATDALKYVGQGYTYGGPSSPGAWDCSSFVSYVLGHDLGMNIPGGSWATVTDNGHTHGPASTSYMLFGTGVAFNDAQPGDLVVTVLHMGIVIGKGQMVSAQDPALGTGIGDYTSGFPGGQPVVRRVST